MDIKCPHCESENVRLDEDGNIRDAMESWACDACGEWFPVMYEVKITQVGY